MRKRILTFLLGGILGISLASGGIFIDAWEFWVVWVCLLGMCLNLAHD